MTSSYYLLTLGAFNMELVPIEKKVINQKTASYIGEHLYAKNTMNSYQADIRVFKRWAASCGIVTPSLQNVIDFFIEAKETKKITTLNRYKTALTKVYPNLIKCEVVALFFQALRNEKACQVKHSTPLLDDEFIESLKHITSDMYRFMLTLQYKGAFRISEVLALRVKDIVIEDGGLKVLLTKTKTSKEGVTVGIKNNGGVIVDMFTRYVKAHSLNEDDKLFNVKRCAVYRYIKRNFGNEYGSHSLRSGHITSCILKKKELPVIMKTSRHKSATTLVNSYYKPASVFDNTSDII